MIEILFGFYGTLAGEEQFFSHRSWQPPAANTHGWEGSAGITSPSAGEDTVLVGTSWLNKERQDPLGHRMLVLEGGGGCRCHSPAPQRPLQMVEIPSHLCFSGACGSLG